MHILRVESYTNVIVSPYPGSGCPVAMLLFVFLLSLRTPPTVVPASIPAISRLITCGTRFGCHELTTRTPFHFHLCRNVETLNKSEGVLFRRKFGSISDGCYQYCCAPKTKNLRC